MIYETKTINVNGLEFGVINISEQALKDLNNLIKKNVKELNCSIQNKHKNINDNKFIYK